MPYLIEIAIEGAVIGLAMHIIMNIRIRNLERRWQAKLDAVAEPLDKLAKLMEERP